MTESGFLAARPSAMSRWPSQTTSRLVIRLKSFGFEAERSDATLQLRDVATGMVQDDTFLYFLDTIAWNVSLI